MTLRWVPEQPHGVKLLGTHINNGDEKSGDVRCCQVSGARGNGHVGLPDKKAQVVSSIHHSHANVADDGWEGFQCRVLGVGIDWIIVSEQIRTRKYALMTQLVVKRRKAAVEASQDDANRRGDLVFDDWAGAHCDSSGEEDRGDHEATHYSKKIKGVVRTCILECLRDSESIERFIYLDPDYTHANETCYKCLSQMDKDPEEWSVCPFGSRHLLTISIGPSDTWVSSQHKIRMNQDLQPCCPFKLYP